MKLYVTSDIHSAYTPMKKALDEAGFEPGNKEHLLIVCGDLFDRMDESQQVLDYMMSVPNKVLIFGNHEDLMTSMCRRGFPRSNDFHNGTHKTVCDLAPNAKEFHTACAVTMEKLNPLFDKMVDYFESEHYVFVHSTLPVGDDWRESHKKDWMYARWPNPFEEAALYKNLPENKTLVFGHWHTSWMWSRNGIGSEWGDDACFKPYYGNGFIGIDSCVAYTGFCSVVVLEDNLLEDLVW